MHIIINNSSMVPIYEQIIDQIKSAIIRGELQPDTVLPSVRSLSKELKISALTVKKAYDNLEEEGFTVTVHGKGTYVAATNKNLMREEQLKEVEHDLEQAIKDGKEILLEGQLGTLKDPDHGIYPMVTSSSTLAAYGAIGAGLPPYEITKIVTVCKAYSSAVGAGAFVSEIFGEEADELRRRGGDGGEFGATTGRPRRMGWFDCVATKYGCRLQGATDVAFTVLDALGYLDEIPVCVGYEIDGEVTTDFPVTYKLEKACLLYTSPSPRD